MFSLTLMIGCVSKYQPNINILQDKYSGATDGKFDLAKSILADINKSSPIIAAELGKLPELQDGITDQEVTALRKLKDLYQNESKGFEQFFNRINAVGLAENRKYCSPLQALFWIAEKETSISKLIPIETVSLKALLKMAWVFEPQVDWVQAQKIVDTIKDDQLRKDYNKEIKKKNKFIQNWLQADLKRSPSVFPFGASRKIKKLSRAKHWEDFDQTMARLNSPELVDFYVKKQISYENYWNIPSYDPRGYNPKYVFNNKSGDCYYISNFVVHALKINGYTAWLVKLAPERSTDLFHAVCVYKMGSEKFIIDDGRDFKRGIMKYKDY